MELGRRLRERKEKRRGGGERRERYLLRAGAKGAGRKSHPGKRADEISMEEPRLRDIC